MEINSSLILKVTLKMLGWVSNWWTTASFTGPARNAPNGGKGIKDLFDQRPKQVIVLTDAQIKQVRTGLRKAETNSTPAELHESPILQELDNVFKQGTKNYFSTVQKNVSEDNKDAKLERSKEAKVEARNRVAELMKRKREHLLNRNTTKDNSIATLKQRAAAERAERKRIKALGIAAVGMIQKAHAPMLDIEAVQQDVVINQFTPEDVLNRANEFETV